MILKLKNVRQHLDKTYHIPDKGVVKLAGQSGKGKSSIFDAIMHCLFGTMDDMVHWDKDSAEIHMEYLGMGITRHMRPNTLKVVDVDGKTYIDDAAQGVINLRLGMNEEETKATSYLQQGLDDSLFKLKPAEQLRFLQRLAFGDDDPETTKVRIAELRAQRFAAVAALQKQIDDLSIKSQNEQQNLTRLELLRPIVPEGLKTEDEVATLRDLATATRTNMSVASAKISRLNKELNSPVYAEFASLDALRAQHAAGAAKIQGQMLELNKELAAVGDVWSKEAYDANVALETQYSAALAYLAEFEKAKTYSADLKSRYGIEGSPLEWLKSEYARARQAWSDSMEAKNAAESEVMRSATYRDGQPCPHCQGPLLVERSGSIVKHDHKVHDHSVRHAALQKEWEAAKIAAAEADSYCGKIQKELNKFEQMRKDLSLHTKADCTKEQAEAEIAKLRVARETNVYRSREAQDLATKMKLLGNVLANQARDFASKAEATTEKAKTLRPKQEIAKEIEILENVQVNLNTSWSETQLALDEQSKKAEAAAALKLHEVKVSQVQGNLHRMAQEQSDLEIRLTEASALLKGVLRLKELSDKAAMESLEAMLGGINLNTSRYIEQIFPDDGTIVSIQNKKVIESGEERARLSLRLTHKGSNPKTMRSWSGGEKSRVALAGQLGLSDMYNSPFILVDEVMAWLGKEDKERCCEVFRTLSENKLILLIEHQLPDSMVDQVIEV